jgi:hypothetical protein
MVFAFASLLSVYSTRSEPLNASISTAYIAILRLILAVLLALFSYTSISLNKFNLYQTPHHQLGK